MKPETVKKTASATGAGVIAAVLTVWGPGILDGAKALLATREKVTRLEERQRALRRDNEVLRAYVTYLAQRVDFHHGQGALPPPPAPTRFEREPARED
jgi:hypothetical protein